MGKRRIVEGNGRDDSGLEKIGEGMIMEYSREKEEEGMIMNGNGEDDSGLEKSGGMERTERNGGEDSRGLWREGEGTGNDNEGEWNGVKWRGE